MIRTNQFFSLIFLFLVTLTATQCNWLISSVIPPPDTSPVMDIETLIDDLTASAGTIELAGEVSQPFFPVSGQLIRVFDENIQVFQFPDSVAAEQAAALVSPDGFTIGTMHVDWVNSPHFYKRDRIIVLYVGDTYDLTQVLQSILGPQFAGGIAIPDI